MSIIFSLSCREAHVLFLLCFIRFFFFFFFLFPGSEKAAPAATEDNYTNTDKSASTVTHWRVGVLLYATSYHLQRLCKTEKGTGNSGAGHRGERCAESRSDPGRWREEEEDRITSPTEPLTSTHWGQKNHTGFFKFQSQYFFFLS